ncbi:heavy metal translocating P-type ATPase [Marinobacteraceae bacterium S3BR75-40.1]
MTQTSNRCYHCQEPIPAGVRIERQQHGETLAFCCQGCRAVNETLSQEGLGRFYSFRTAPPPKPPESVDPRLKERLCELDSPLLQANFTQALDNGHREARLLIEGMTCAACVWLLEHHLEQLEGVERFSVNHSTRQATLVWNPDVTALSQLLLAIEQLGYHAKPYERDELESQLKREKRRTLIRLCIAGIGAMQSMMLAMPLYFGMISGVSTEMILFFRWVSLLVATPVVFYSASPFFRAAWRDLKTRHLTMDVPVALAIGLAYLASMKVTLLGGEEVYFDAVCMFTFFLTLGRYVEMQARYRSGLMEAGLASALPPTARRLKDNQETLVPVGQVQTGDHIGVRPGEALPFDGRVVSGTSHLSEAVLTGEYLPLLKKPGDDVIAGSVNGETPLVIEVTRPAGKTRLHAIMGILDRVQSQKPRTAQLADNVAAYFVGTVLIVAASVYIFWHSQGAPNAFDIMLSVLVVTCPCALSLATPTALTAATTALRQRGFLPTRGYALEALAQIDTVVFDKTGTLTEGRLRVSHADTAEGLAENDARALASALERHSEHPVASAFETPGAFAENVENHVGQGLSGDIQGTRYYIGSRDFVSQQCGDRLPPEGSAEGLQVYLATQDRWLAVFYLDDQLRSTSADAIRQLNAMGIATHLLSGDQPAHVHRIASAAGIDKAHAGASPEDKLSVLQALEKQGHRVMVVGDGLNDLPAMAGARLSVAMGAAADLTRLRADGVLLGNNPLILASAIDRARKTRRVIAQNLSWALLYNLIALPAAVAGWVPPWLAALGMSISSLVVVLNALRLSSRADDRAGGNSLPLSHSSAETAASEAAQEG